MTQKEIKEVFGSNQEYYYYGCRNQYKKLKEMGLLEDLAKTSLDMGDLKSVKACTLQIKYFQKQKLHYENMIKLNSLTEKNEERDQRYSEEIQMVEWLIKSCCRRQEQLRKTNKDLKEKFAEIDRQYA